MNPTQLIAYLNALSVGELDTIAGKLVEAEGACRELGQDDLADRIVQARHAISAADPRTFRKHVEAVVSKLGHLK